MAIPGTWVASQPTGLHLSSTSLTPHPVDDCRTLSWESFSGAEKIQNSRHYFA
jgi:hypothetical protein